MTDEWQAKDYHGYADPVGAPNESQPIRSETNTKTTNIGTPLNKTENKPALTETMLEIGAKLFPRRYHRFKDLRPDQEACEWARTLDWRQNPYDRFLLRREILHHLESTAFHEGRLNVYSFASRDEIAAEVDRLMDAFPHKYEGIGVFSYALMTIPWNLAFKHGRVSRAPHYTGEAAQ